MSTSKVLHFWVVLAAIVLTAATTASSRCISCPCGSSGQNLTYCSENSLDDQLTCEGWANCQTCAENIIFCSSCPPHRFGHACSEVCGQIPQRTNRKPGSVPTYGDFPWTMGIAALNSIDAENVFCGGVILDKKTVLTAAQCVTGAQNILLLFGAAYPTAAGYSGSEQRRRISRIILHPDFDNETKTNDLAVLKFEPELNFSHTIPPICLPAINSSDSSLLIGQKGLIPGWGYDYTLYMYIPAVKYQVANVTLQPSNRCVEACESQGMTSCSTPKMLCADYPKGVDACMYLGAPMVIYDEETERYTLAGLVTRKLTAKERNCRRGEIHTVLTNVSHFMPFILQNLS